MNFDFYEQFKDYSSIDLLKIVKRPTGYQPEAIAVATQILSERQMSAEEVETVDEYFQRIDGDSKAEREKTDALKNKVVDFFEPILHPTRKVAVKKWVNILLLFIAIQYAGWLFNIVRVLVAFPQWGSPGLDLTFWIELFTLLYIPFIFFLLFNKRRWGWILLFADNLFCLITRASQSHIFFKYGYIHHGNTVYFLLPIVTNATFVFFLWRDPVVNYFAVSKEARKTTAMITTAATLLYIILIYLMV